MKIAVCWSCAADVGKRKTGHGLALPAGRPPRRVAAGPCWRRRAGVGRRLRRRRRSPLLVLAIKALDGGSHVPHILSICVWAGREMVSLCRQPLLPAASQAGGQRPTAAREHQAPAAASCQPPPTRPGSSSPLTAGRGTQEVDLLVAGKVGKHALTPSVSACAAGDDLRRGPAQRAAPLAASGVWQGVCVGMEWHMTTAARRPAKGCSGGGAS